MSWGRGGRAGTHHGGDSTVADEGLSPWLTINTLEGTDQEKDEKYSKFQDLELTTINILIQSLFPTPVQLFLPLGPVPIL